MILEALGRVSWGLTRLQSREFGPISKRFGPPLFPMAREDAAHVGMRP